MSNSLAIAAVTTTLQSILFASATTDPDLIDTTVTTLPLDKARGTNTNNQLNLFLYQVARNAAFSNRELYPQVRPGETGFPPLALNLYYLVTAFGRDSDVSQPFGHELLGKAMIALHDHALLSPEEIRNATAATLSRSDLDRQLERVRITLHPLTIEEISKLWTGFATQYRLSAAYEVAVTLIESSRPVRAPLPALTRGPGDSGARAAADLTPPFPALDELVFPKQQSSVRLNEVLTLRGHDLDGTNVVVVFNHPLWAAPVSIAVAAGANATATQVALAIPNDAVNWPAGFYTAQVRVQRPGDSFQRQTNLVSFALAPTVSISPTSAPAGSITYTVNISPEVRAGQRASLLLGSQEVLPEPTALPSGVLTFTLSGLLAGDYFVRVRVAGVDSLLVNKNVAPPAFDPAQKVTVT